MDLLVVQLKAAIRRLLDAKGIRARVLDKVNRYGEVVIGVILEKPPGSAHAEPSSRGSGNAGQGDREGRALAEHGGDVDRPAVLRDDLPRDP